MWGGNAYITPEDVSLWEDVRDISNWSERMRTTLGAVYGDELQPMNNRFTDGMAALMSEKDGDVCLGALHRIACPTLVLAGQHDAMVRLGGCIALRFTALYRVGCRTASSCRRPCAHGWTVCEHSERDVWCGAGVTGSRSIPCEAD